MCRPIFKTWQILKVLFVQKHAKMCACVQAHIIGVHMSLFVYVCMPNFADWYIGTPTQEKVGEEAKFSCRTPKIRYGCSLGIKLFLSSSLVVRKSQSSIIVVIYKNCDMQK